MKTLQSMTLAQLIADIRTWNNHDLRNFDEITPNRQMLLARRRVIAEVAKRIAAKSDFGVVQGRRTTNKRKLRPVLVTTVHKGVFFGYAECTTGTTITLERARCCVMWSTKEKGFLGLAAFGPSDQCRVGPAAHIELRDVTCVAEVTPIAVAAWEKAPWKK